MSALYRQVQRRRFGAVRSWSETNGAGTADNAGADYWRDFGPASWQTLRE